jgi:hypothetical protein
MGAAQSSNVSSAVTNLSNFVSNSTTANATQTSQVQEEIKIKNCYIQLSGDFNVNSSANLAETNTQIVGGMQDANLSNNIQQQMLQQATSKVGFLGIGYANANNSANELINSTTSITNDMTASANQFSSTADSFICDRSTIIADNMNIGFYSNSDFLSSQTLNNSQTAKVVNDVSQSVTQKATATVEGIGGLLLALLLILAVIIYAIGKPLSSGAAKTAVTASLGFVIAGIGVFMYLRNTSPFFSIPSNCINHSAIGMGTGSDIPECINMKNQKLNLASPPTKYIYPILPTDSAAGPGGNLIQMAIAQISGQSKSDCGPNGGYRVDTMNNLENRIKQYLPYAQMLGIPNIPNPLTLPTTPTGDSANPYFAIPIEYMPNMGGVGSGGSVCTPGTCRVDSSSSLTDLTQCYKIKQTSTSGLGFNPSIWINAKGFTNLPSMGIANINLDGDSGWTKYLQNRDEKTALFARFVLCDIIGNIDLHHWSKPNELIKFIGDDNIPVIDVAATEQDNQLVLKYPNDTYFYHPDNAPSSWSDAIQGSGYIEGNIGVLNDRQYKFEQFMKKIGIWIIFGIVVLTIAYMFFGNKGGEGKASEGKASEGKAGEGKAVAGFRRK